MLFNSFSYLPFLALTVALFWAVPECRRRWILLGAGLAFYASHSLSSLLVITGLAFVTYAIGNAIERGHRGPVLALGVTLLISVFAFFKYESFLTGTVHVLTGISLHPEAIALPLGISFFLFEFLHYMIEIWRKRLPRHGFLDFLNFSFFFPTLVSGPIKRFAPFSQSILDLRFRPAFFLTGLGFILLGYAQKYILADPLIPFTTVLAHPEALQTAMSARIGLLFYSFRIYFDFAGLSNIAIGSAMLFGILVPKNFDLPYLSSNLQEFWQRWHMSLSSWVRDYIYISLGGNRRGKVREALNLLVAMAIVGIWHGAGWNFVIWGLWHGLGLILHRVWKLSGLRLPSGRIGYLLGMTVTFSFVTIGWAFFVTTSLHDSLLLLSRVF